MAWYSICVIFVYFNRRTREGVRGTSIWMAWYSICVIFVYFNRRTREGVRGTSIWMAWYSICVIFVYFNRRTWEGVRGTSIWMAWYSICVIFVYFNRRTQVGVQGTSIWTAVCTGTATYRTILDQWPAVPTDGPRAFTMSTDDQWDQQTICREIIVRLAWLNIDDRSPLSKKWG